MSKPNESLLKAARSYLALIKMREREEKLNKIMKIIKNESNNGK
jgi:hypothetical protein